jgi:hypothetical protein
MIRNNENEYSIPGGVISGNMSFNVVRDGKGDEVRGIINGEAEE